MYWTLQQHWFLLPWLWYFRLLMLIVIPDPGATDSHTCFCWISILHIAFSTASSEGAVPQTGGGNERFGCNNKISSRLLPLVPSTSTILCGATLCHVHRSRATTSLSGYGTLSGRITMLLVFMLTSGGIAGFPGLRWWWRLQAPWYVNLAEAGRADIGGLSVLRYGSKMHIR